MRAIVVDRFGGPDVLAVHDVPAPKLQPGHAIVAVGVAGLNFLDVARRRGDYPQPLPFTPGVEAVGRLLAAEGGSLREGQRVGVVMVPGTYAEQLSVPVDRVLPIPDDIADETAAAVLLQGLTAHVLTSLVCPVRAGQTVVVRAAAGGVGSLLVQLAVASGATVLGTASAPDKLALVESLGAAPVDSTADVPAQVRELTAQRGADVFFESAGGSSFDESVTCLAPMGVLVGYGQSGGPWQPVDSRQLADRGSLTLVRPRLTDYVATKDDLLRHAAAVFDNVRSGRMAPHISRVVTLADLPDAHALIESGRSVGKLLMRP